MPIKGYNPDAHKPGPELPEFSDRAARILGFESAAALHELLSEKSRAGKDIGDANTHLRNYSAWLKKGASDDVLQDVGWDARNELKKLGLLPGSE